jgi:hypothetical protein
VQINVNNTKYIMFGMAGAGVKFHFGCVGGINGGRME